MGAALLAAIERPGAPPVGLALLTPSHWSDGTLIDLAPGDWLDVPLVWHMWDIQTPFTHALSDNLIATARKWLIQA